MNANLNGSTGAFAIVALDLIGMVVITALGHPIPDILSTIALVAAGAGGGAAVPHAVTPVTPIPVPATLP